MNEPLLQVQSEVNGTTHIDIEEIRNFTNGLIYPLYFLDFETIGPAVPKYNGSRPYQQLVFQYSLHIQETVLKQFCSINNYPIVDVYTEDYSGKDFNRPEWNKIISYLKKNKGKVDQILCLRWDRWSRNQYLALKEIKTLDKLGVLISTVETNPSTYQVLILRSFSVYI